MDIRIVYCRLCGYRGRAHELADQLRERFGAEVSVDEGRFGQFDVWLDGELLASRGEGFLARMRPVDAPSHEAVLAAVTTATAPREGEVCRLPEREADRSALSAEEDPVLAEVWRHDDVYDDEADDDGGGS